MKKSNYIYGILNRVYNEIYVKISNKTIHCFLCGAAKPKEGQSQTVRDQLKNYIDGTSIKVLYAEDLFKNLVNVNNEKNLLNLENILADNADIIVIVLESYGAFVELGAFVNTDNLRNKLIILMDSEFKDDESFVNLGPLKVLKFNRKKSVIHYEECIDKEVAIKVKKSMNEYFENTGIKHTNDLNSIIALYYFLQIYYCYFSPVTFDEIVEHIKFVSKNIGSDIKDRIRTANRLLYKDGLAKKEKDNFYVLTEKGYDLVRGLIADNKIKLEDKHLLDKLRLAVLNQKLRLERHKYQEYYL